MIQKPVNPSPNNETVDGSKPITLSCEVPKGNVDGYSVKMYSVDSGEVLYQNTVETLQDTTNKISQAVPTDKYIQGEEYAWNCTYWRKRSILETLNCFTQISLPSQYEGQTVTLNPEIESNQIICIPPSSLAVATYKFEPQTYPNATFSLGLFRIVSENSNVLTIDDYISTQYETFLKIWYVLDGETYIYYTKVKGRASTSTGGEYTTYAYDITPRSNASVSFSSYNQSSVVTVEIFTTEQENIQLDETNSILIGYEDDNKYKYESVNITSCSWWNYEKNSVIYKGCNGISGISPSSGSFNNPDYYYLRGYLLLTLDANLTQSYINNYSVTGIGDNLSNNCIIKIYSSTQDINYSPDYYFQTRTPAAFTIVNTDLTEANSAFTLSKPSTSFSVTYSQIEGTELNYYRMYLYEKGKNSNKYRQIKESELFINSTDTFQYSGFISGNEYKIEAVGTTADGETITAEKVFSCEYDYTLDCSSEIRLDFNPCNNSTEIQISPTGTLSGLSSCQIYRYDCTSEVLEYVGELYSSAIDTKYTMVDYNIGNNKQYSYIIQYKENNVTKYCKTTEIFTDFCGESIMSVRKNNNGYEVVDNISLSLSFSNEMSEIKLNIANEYTSGFGEWEIESKGYVGNIQGSVKAILPQEYSREQWETFVKNDDIKIYKLLDGGIYIVGIDSSSIQPCYFPNDGIINDASFSYRALGNTKGMSICKALYSEEG